MVVKSGSVIPGSDPIAVWSGLSHRRGGIVPSRRSFRRIDLFRHVDHSLTSMGWRLLHMEGVPANGWIPLRRGRPPLLQCRLGVSARGPRRSRGAVGGISVIAVRGHLALGALCLVMDRRRRRMVMHPFFSRISPVAAPPSIPRDLRIRPRNRSRADRRLPDFLQVCGGERWTSPWPRRWG